jgi:hypothetical protein
MPFALANTTQRGQGALFPHGKGRTHTVGRHHFAGNAWHHVQGKATERPRSFGPYFWQNAQELDSDRRRRHGKSGDVTLRFIQSPDCISRAIEWLSNNRRFPHPELPFQTREFPPPPVRLPRSRPNNFPAQWPGWSAACDNCYN